MRLRHTHAHTHTYTRSATLPLATAREQKGGVKKRRGLILSKKSLLFPFLSITSSPPALPLPLPLSFIHTAPPSCLHFCSVPFSFSNLFSLSPISSFLYIAVFPSSPLLPLRYTHYALPPSVISLTNVPQTRLPQRPRELQFLPPKVFLQRTLILPSKDRHFLPEGCHYTLKSCSARTVPLTRAQL